MTIELIPTQYANTQYEFPNGSAAALPEGWNDYWKKCLADSNIGHLEAISKGSFLVDIESLDNAALHIILENELSKADLSDPENSICKISGGVAIRVEDKYLIEPNCCCDIGDLLEWESILENGKEDWSFLWIGHPWVYYRKDGALFEFSEYVDQTDVNFESLKTSFSIECEKLDAEIRMLREKQIAFEGKLAAILKEMEINDAEKIAQLLIGLA